MGERLGDRLLVNNKITEEQLREALEHQRLNGGRLGKNLVALGLISEEELPGFFKQAPKVPRTIEDTGLGAPFIADLILKHAVQMEEFRIQEMGERVKLPVSLVDKAIDDLRRDRFIEVKGAGQISRLSYILAVTDAGRNRAADLYSVCRYMGPAPVLFDEYRRQVEIQTVKSIMVSEESVRRSARGGRSSSTALPGTARPPSPRRSGGYFRGRSLSPMRSSSAGRSSQSTTRDATRSPRPTPMPKRRTSAGSSFGGPSSWWGEN
jgi:predicted transcriptional regulator